jgi:hypothetical protein
MFVAIGNLVSQAYAWATAIGLAFTAAVLAILLIRFIYTKT